MNEAIAIGLGIAGLFTVSHLAGGKAEEEKNQIREAGRGKVSKAPPTFFKKHFKEVKYINSKKDVSTEDISTKDVSTKDVSTKDISTKDVSTKDVSTKDVSTENKHRHISDTGNTGKTDTTDTAPRVEVSPEAEELASQPSRIGGVAIKTDTGLTGVSPSEAEETMKEKGSIWKAETHEPSIDVSKVHSSISSGEPESKGTYTKGGFAPAGVY